MEKPEEELPIELSEEDAAEFAGELLKALLLGKFNPTEITRIVHKHVQKSQTKKDRAGVSPQPTDNSVHLIAARAREKERAGGGR